jgi:hypothetical protein
MRALLADISVKEKEQPETIIRMWNEARFGRKIVESSDSLKLRFY